MLNPERLNSLINENVVPVVRLRSADEFQGVLQIMRVIGNDRRGFLYNQD
jgi:hypothetical protein